jgi:hypothetical protein
VPSRTAEGTVRSAASRIAAAAKASDAHDTHVETSPSTASATSAAKVASMTVAIRRFIGAAAVVTRA